MTGEGVEALTEAVRERIAGLSVTGQVSLGPEQSRIRAKLFDWRAVRAERPDPAGGWTIDVALPARRWRELRESEGLSDSSVRRKCD